MNKIYFVAGKCKRHFSLDLGISATEINNFSVVGVWFLIRMKANQRSNNFWCHIQKMDHLEDYYRAIEYVFFYIQRFIEFGG